MAWPELESWSALWLVTTTWATVLACSTGKDAQDGSGSGSGNAQPASGVGGSSGASAASDVGDAPSEPAAPTPTTESSVDVAAGGSQPMSNAEPKPMLEDQPEPEALEIIQPNFVPRVLSDHYRPDGVSVADFTGDGLLDIASGSFDDPETYLYAAPDYAEQLISRHSSSIFATALDVDGDGVMEPVFGRYRPGTIFWLERPNNDENDAAEWSAHTIDSAASGGADGVHGLFPGDVNGDGQLDLLATAGLQDSLYWYEVPADPRQPWVRSPVANGDAPALTHYIGFGDVNADGRPDVATGGKQGNFFAWWEQPEDLTRPWTKHHLSDEPGASHISMVDVDGDDVMDMVASRGHGRGLLWYQGPDFKKQPLDDSMLWPHAMEVADLDNDGDLDVVAASATEAQGLAWFENDGTGNFTKHLLETDQEGYQIAVSDIDADGDQDFVLAGHFTNNLVLYENRPEP